MKPIIIIPARYGSKRYKGKPLVKILGREMILRVADICSKISGKKDLYIATDNKKISSVVNNAGYKSIMTSKKCLTGTDRVAEVSKKISSDIYINVQGDEPMIKLNDIKKIIEAKKKDPGKIICGYSRLSSNENPNSLNIPKVVINTNDELVYISRSPVPVSKSKKIKIKYFKQVCIYGFSKKDLKLFNSREKTPIEKIEDIEILRFLEKGKKIKMVKLKQNSYAVDTKQDIKKIENYLKKK